MTHQRLKYETFLQFKREIIQLRILGTIQTATLSGNYKVGLVYGSISVIYVGNNNFKIQPDIYDFDIHWKMGLRTLIRNIETIGASYLHGTGTPFKIIFNGLYHNK